MPQSEKISLYHEHRILNSACYTVLMRSVGTPYENRARTMHDLALRNLADYQSDPSGVIAQNSRIDTTPLLNLLADIASTNLDSAEVF